MTLLLRLKTETRGAHDRIEQALDLDARTSTISAYRSLVQRLYGFHAAWEAEAAEILPDPGCLEGRARTPLLARDLLALGCGEDAVAGLPLCRPILRHAGFAEALGAMYGQRIGLKLMSVVQPAQDARMLRILFLEESALTPSSSRSTCMGQACPSRSNAWSAARTTSRPFPLEEGCVLQISDDEFTAAEKKTAREGTIGDILTSLARQLGATIVWPADERSVLVRAAFPTGERTRSRESTGG